MAILPNGCHGVNTDVVVAKLRGTQIGFEVVPEDLFELALVKRKTDCFGSKARSQNQPIFFGTAKNQRFGKKNVSSDMCLRGQEQI